MAINALQEAADSIGQMGRAVMRDPGSPEARISVENVVRHLDRFVASDEIRQLLQLPPTRRPTLPPTVAESIQGLFDGLQAQLSVAIQFEDLGGHVDWIVPLENALDRLQRTFAQLGVSVDRSWKPGPPIMTRVMDADGHPQINVTTTSFRKPQLAPYIELAMRDAQPIEIEPGHWYADLDRFPGVWADGATPEECRATLADVLHEWLVTKVIRGDQDIPVLENLDPRSLVLPI